MVVALPLFVVLQQLLACGGRHVGVAQPLPYILDRRSGGVQQIVGIETVVTQLVEHNLVRGEVTDLCGVLRLQLLNGEQQDGFAELVGVHAIALMTNGADGEHPVFVGIAVDERSPCCQYILHGEPAACELGFGQLVAVSHHLSVAIIYVRRAEGDEHRIGLGKRLVQQG